MAHFRFFSLMAVGCSCISIILCLWSLINTSKRHVRFSHAKNVHNRIPMQFQHVQKTIHIDTPNITCSAATPMQRPEASELATPKLVLFHNFPDYYSLENLSITCENICEFSVNGSRFTEADAVVFFSHTHISNVWGRLRPYKRTDQIWVFFSVESPIYSNNAIFGEPPWHMKFNWTMTYRRDSEFWHGYVRTVPRRVPAPRETRLKDEQRWQAMFDNKTKMVAWFVSHCPTDSHREEYAANLSKYISVDIYGSCGPNKCEDRSTCWQMLSKDYKFYLAFENSLCLDYVTEKLKAILDLNTLIPVVRGGADYHMMFPANSLINTKDFSSPKHLALYLLFLAKHKEAYIKFLQWSWEHEVKGPDMPICQLCDRVNQRQENLCFYDNVYAWWSLDTCRTATDLG